MHEAWSVDEQRQEALREPVEDPRRFDVFPHPVRKGQIYRRVNGPGLNGPGFGEFEVVYVTHAFAVLHSTQVTDFFGKLRPGRLAAPYVEAVDRITDQALRFPYFLVRDVQPTQEVSDGREDAGSPERGGGGPEPE